jgi:ABC-type antimicrobial peptide transport system permease subunit
MLKHYFKIAFRNLWKYKNQTLVSVLGLAVGFACFAVATLWIRYEMTYDGFHKNADRMYCVYGGRTTPYPLAGHLKDVFPEIARTTPVTRPTSMPLEVAGVIHNADFLRVDSSFFGMFDVKVVEGSMDFLIPKSKNIAITREKAQQLFGNENPIGKAVLFKNYENAEYTVCAIVTGLPKHSNYPFDILASSSMNMQWNYSGEHTLVELLPGIDAEAFMKKLYEYEFKWEWVTISKMTLTPLTTLRYTEENMPRDVKFQYIIIFSVVGLLLVLCTLFNYLTLFISRFRIRQREFALRVTFGSSNRSLLALLTTEFLISLVIALLFGLILIYAIIPPFREMSGVMLGLSSIYAESLVYIAGIILVSLLTFTLILAVFRRRTLSAGMRRGNRKLFRKTSIAFQLIVSIGFSFCTIVILKQVHHLHNTDLGFEFKNRGSIVIDGGKIDMAALENKIRQIPEITETVAGLEPLIPSTGWVNYGISEWEDKPEKAKNLNIEYHEVSERFLQHYDIRLTEGELLSEDDESQYVLINESTKKALGWHSAVGKSIKYKGDRTVKGVIKDIYNRGPMTSASLACYFKHEDIQQSILFKYNGAWEKCRRKIEEITGKEYNYVIPIITGEEEAYDKYLKSENTLLKILSLVSLVCVIVCVFGFVSMVSLTCEERRKEIAIRKINGATIKDILDIFFKEYLTLLVVGALLAFPAGYIIMKRWLEEYVMKTEINAWIYLSILLALIMAIVMCVGGKVYGTSRENPINAIK